jgi:hypothetical protein
MISQFNTRILDSIAAKSLLTIGALALGLSLSSQAFAAGGAFAVDDSEVGKVGECKVESWASFMTGNPDDFIGAVSPACVVSLGRPVEISAAITRSRSDREWATGGEIKGKTNIISTENSRIGVGFVGGYGYDFTGSSTAAYFLKVPVTFVVNDVFRINANGGYTHEKHDIGNVDLFSWGGGFEWTLYSAKVQENERSVTLIGEVFGVAGARAVDADGEKESSKTRDPRGQVGLRFTPQEKFDIDVIYGRNITGEDDNWVTVGLNVRF